MPLAIGAEVVVATLGRKRGIVIESGGGGRYRVRLDNVTVWCRERDLSAAPAKRKGKQPAVPRSAGQASEAGTAEPGCVDLHGLTVDEALARVVDEIDRALRRGADRLEVIHGKGSGRVRAALHRHLASMPVVAAWHLDPRNPGVTWVCF